MNKNYKKKNIKVVPLFSFLVCFFVLFLSVGFATFQVSLDINDINAIIRVQKDIRITGISLVNSENNAISGYEDYNINSINSSISLPNSNSSITYDIIITNIGNVEMGISNITGLPSNLEYSINNYNLKEKLCDNSNNTICKLGSVSTLSITIGYANNGYNSGNTNYQINMNFAFERIFTISYNGFLNVSSLPSTILEGDSKTITFDNVTGIPYAVQVNNATGTYSNPVLILSNASNNVIINRYYKITYILNGGDNDNDNPDKFLSSDNITLKNPTYINHVFDGWYENNDFSGNAVTNISNRYTDITLYAKFILDAMIYNISYNLNGGTNPNNQVLSFSLSTPQNILDPVKNYYIFDGWYENSSFTGTKITTTSQLTGSTLLYAKWLEMGENTTYNSNTNTFTATNIQGSVTLTSFIGNSDYNYTFVNTTGDEIKRVEVTVSYTNNTGNTSSQMTCELYLNNSAQATTTDTKTLTAKKTSGTVTFNLSVVIAETDTFIIKFPNCSLTNGTVSEVSFKVYNN